MRFIYPFCLLALAALPFIAALGWWLLRRARARAALFASNAARANENASRANAQLILAMLALLFLALAAARPQWGQAEQRGTSRARNLIIALDVSRSMLAADVHPNRLERAKADIMDLLDDLGGDNVGLLVFRGKANMICPLTTDRAFLRQAIDGITIDSAPRGETDIGDAIKKALDAFESAYDDNNALIIITDGEDLAGHADAVAKTAAERAIPIFTIGIGDPAGAAVPEIKFQGKEVRSKLTESTLIAIANATGGAYVPLATSATASTTLGAIYRNYLSRVAAREIEEQRENRYIERYPIFLIPAIILLLSAAFLSRGRLVAARRAAAIFIIFDGINSAANAQQAADHRIIYNEACAAYKTNDFSRAAELLAPLSARRDRDVRAAELYAAAQFKLADDPLLSTNSAARLDALSLAAETFRKVLHDEPNDARGRNLDRAVKDIPTLREAVRLEEIMAKFGQTPPQGLIGTLLAEERALLKEAPEAFNNPDAANSIAALEALAKRQSEAADIFIPLKQHLLAASGGITNEEARAWLGGHIDATQEKMRTAAQAMDDIDPEALTLIPEAENSAYTFWKMLAEPPTLIQEDILCQTNAYESPATSRFAARPDQPEAAELTEQFRRIFPQWADQWQQQAQTNTNMPPLTAEDRAQIETLALETQDLQKQLLSEITPENQLAALEKLCKIYELLPKPPQQQNQQNQNQQQNQNDKNDEQNNQQTPPQEQPQNQEQNEARNEKDEKAAELPEDVEELLRKALEREKEHDAEKKKRLSNAPMLPNERDW